MRLVMVTLALLTVAWTNPDQTSLFRSTVPPLVTCPAGDMPWTPTLRDSNGNPLVGKQVVLILDAYQPLIVATRQEWGGNARPESLWAVGTGRFAPCAAESMNAADPTFHAVTDSLGQVTFRVKAGGCYPFDGYSLLVDESDWVVFNGSLLSVDAVDDSGHTAAWPYYAPVDCEVGLSDAAWFTPMVKRACKDAYWANDSTWVPPDSCYSVCADFDRNGEIGLGDVVILTPHMAGGHAHVAWPVK